MLRQPRRLNLEYLEEPSFDLFRELYTVHNYGTPSTTVSNAFYLSIY